MTPALSPDQLTPACEAAANLGLARPECESSTEELMLPGAPEQHLALAHALLATALVLFAIWIWDGVFPVLGRRRVSTAGDDVTDGPIVRPGGAPSDVRPAERRRAASVGARLVVGAAGTCTGLGMIFGQFDGVTVRSRETPPVVWVLIGLGVLACVAFRAVQALVVEIVMLRRERRDG